MKRFLDIFFSALGLTILVPLFAVIAILIKADSPGPVFFRQKRAGKDFRLFDIYKFRTMVRDAPQKGPAITVRDDLRITKVGQFLRKTKIDELPELLNILKGDMSLVGPRPEMPEYAEMFRDDYREILRVRPGITDYAAIEYRDEEKVLKRYLRPEDAYIKEILPEKIEMYKRYLAEKSFLTDMKLIFLTLRKVLYLMPYFSTHRLKNPRFYLMIAGDAALFVLAHLLAYGLRFEFALPQPEIRHIWMALPWFVPLKLSFFLSFGLYRGMWRYTGIRDLWQLTQATVLSMIAGMVVLLYLYRFGDFSRAVFFLDGLLTFLFTGGFRLFIRSFFTARARTREDQAFLPVAKNRKRALIVGAGDAGEKILREVMDNYQLHYEITGFIDDNPHKQGRSIHGVPVLASVEKLSKIVKDEEIQEVLIAIPSAGGDQMRRIVGICKRCDVSYKTLPGIGEIIDGSVSVKVLRDVSYQDLLGRPLVKLDTPGIRECLNNRTVLVTGCGGSIGAELCRQLVRFQPRSLVLVDAGEENLFQIQMELCYEMHYDRCQTVLGQVQDRSLMEMVFQKHRPQVVFHAAAYKHVPMLEKNPWEAVFNNVQGSQVVMELALEYGVERFVLASTHRAAQPGNVMEASKRVTELLLQSLQGNGTHFMAVRFGNAVGSSGSVIPLFRRQIEHGASVTVTHPETTRYFIAIPEAARLIIQASAMGEGGEIFILEMGTPVRIVDMARDLIRLSGKEPDRDVKIIFTGLREGEKLHEEPIPADEDIAPTWHDKIMALNPNRRSGDLQSSAALKERLYIELGELYEIAAQHDSRAIKEKLRDIVPEYTPQD